MDAEIIAVGTELVCGQVRDTNSSYLSRALTGVGLRTVRHSVVGDDENALVDCVREAMGRSRLVVVAGGLGPTGDDVTRVALGRVFGSELVLNRKLLLTIHERFRWRKIKPPKGVSGQARIPRLARILPNDVGTAPGLVIEEGSSLVVALPGVPYELEWLTDNRLIPLVRERFPSGTVIRQRVVHTFGLSELAVEEKLRGALKTVSNVTIGYTVSPYGVDIRLTAEGTHEESEKLLEEAESSIRDRLRDAVYGTDGATMEQVVGLMLTVRKMKIAVAESCTGGLVSQRLTEVPGSSEYFERGVVAYSNEAKTSLLGVPKTTIRKFGAVSMETARAMASGVRKLAGTPLGLAITGIAGPGGGSPAKPVGLVHMALAADGEIASERYRLAGTRSLVKLRASQAALAMVRSWLLQH